MSLQELRFRATHLDAVRAGTKRVDAVTDEEAREDGFAGADDVIRGLSSYYPTLQPTDNLLIVRFKLAYPRRMHTVRDSTDAPTQPAIRSASWFPMDK